MRARVMVATASCAVALTGLSSPCRAQVADETPAEERVDDPAARVEVIAGSAAPISERRDPTPAVYVLRDEALHAPGVDAADALGRVPGLEVTRGGGSADLATVSIRGATSAETPIYLAGVRLNDELTGTVDLSSLPLWMLDRVEVYRGNAPRELDELGIGGAIVMVPALPRESRALAALGIGSFGEREARAAVGFGAPTGGAMFGVRHHSAEGDFDFVDDGGTRFDASDDVVLSRDNAHHRETDAWAIGRVEHRGVNLTAFANVFSRDAGAPGLQLLPAERASSALRRLLAGTSARLPCSAGGGCEVIIDVGALVTRYRLIDPRREIGAARITESGGERFAERLRVELRAREWLQLGFGASVSQQLLRVDVERSALGRARRLVVRPELSAVIEPVDALAIAAVGALACHTTSATAGRDTCGILAPVGRVGARLRLAPSLSLFANVGRYVRVPTLGELYGVSAVVRGNDALAEEDGISSDAGLAYQASHGSVDVWAQLVGFVRFADALIGFRRSSLGVIRPYNVDAARVLGLESAASATLWRLLELGATLSALDPRDVSDSALDNDLLPLHARLIASASLALTSPPWPAARLDGARLEARFSQRSSRVADPAGLIQLPERRDLELGASLAFFDHASLSARVANALDDRSVDLIGYPLPGRSFHVEVSSWF